MSKNKYKVPNWTKDIIETELYHYWKNKEIIKELEKDTIEESPLPPDGQPKGNKIGKPTERKAIKIISSRRLSEMQRRIDYIEDAFKMLNEDEQKMAETIFKERYSVIKADMQKNISRHTYYHVKDKLVYYTAKEFGYV